MIPVVRTSELRPELGQMAARRTRGVAREIEGGIRSETRPEVEYRER